jgi:hypothetical protein
VQKKDDLASPRELSRYLRNHAAQTLVGVAGSNTYLARYYVVAFVSLLGIDSNEVFVGLTFMRSISKRIACLCALLTFWSALAFAAHQHSSATESSTCTVCIAAHWASPQTATTLSKVMFVSVSTFRPEPVSAKQRLTVFVLCVRPPPSV